MSDCTGLTQEECNMVQNQNRGLRSPFGGGGGSWLHHVHVWLDADTWHWAWLEIGGVILLILVICGIVALCRSGGGGGESREYQARRSAINASEKYHSQGINRTASEYRRQHPR